MQINWSTILDIFFNHSPMWWFLFPILIPAYIWCDRFWGADGTKRLAKILVVITSVVSWVIAGPALAISTYFWALYRSLSFAGGASAPVNVEQHNNARKRHLWAIPLLMLTLVGMIYPIHNIPIIIVSSVLALVVGYAYAYSATELAYAYGDLVLDVSQHPDRSVGNFNEKLERRRGLYYGIALSFIILLAAFDIMMFKP